MRRRSRALGTSLVFVFVALQACVARDSAGPAPASGGSPPAERSGPAAGGAPSPIPAALLAELLALTEQTRELRALRPVVGVMMNDEEIRRHIREQVGREDMATAERVMLAFGFLPEGASDLEELFVELMSQEVVGLYDPVEDRLIVRREVAHALGSNSPEAAEARSVLVHELVHALQDQVFGNLGETGEGGWADDALSAADCLAEGDATLAMIVAGIGMSGRDPAVTLSPMFGELIRGFSRSSLPGSAALAAAPPYFGYVLGATYFEGAAFAAELRRLGGWAAVDAAHRDPPAGTVHVLHPELYLEGRQPVRVTLPEPVPGLEGRLVVTAVLGELETGAFLLPLGDPSRIARAAEGWAGDRFAVYEREGGGLSLAWRLRFVSEADAAEFLEAARDAEVASGRGPCEEPPAAPGAPRLITCRAGEDVLAGRGADVALARGVAPARAGAVLEALLGAEAVELPPTPRGPATGSPRPGQPVPEQS